MRTFPFARFGLAVLLALLPLAAGMAWGDDAEAEDDAEPVVAVDAPRPDAALTPDVVVAIQLDALQRAADEPAAMTRVFDFTSPENRAVTGPLERFDAMVRAEPFAVLVGHRLSEVLVQGAGEGPLDAQGQPTTWGVVVRVHAVDGRTAAFLWTLSRRPADAEEHPGCWMTDGVQPLADEPPTDVREEVA